MGASILIVITLLAGSGIITHQQQQETMSLKKEIHDLKAPQTQPAQWFDGMVAVNLKKKGKGA